MRYFSNAFVPTSNRRLNELIGFLLFVSAILVFLALASYSPLDPSLNSASALTGSHAARNWIGVVGAIASDLLLQVFGIGIFLAPFLLALLGARWFRSRRTSRKARPSYSVSSCTKFAWDTLRWRRVDPKTPIGSVVRT